MYMYRLIVDFQSFVLLSNSLLREHLSCSTWNSWNLVNLVRQYAPGFAFCMLRLHVGSSTPFLLWGFGESELQALWLQALLSSLSHSTAVRFLYRTHSCVPQKQLTALWEKHLHWTLTYVKLHAAECNHRPAMVDEKQRKETLEAKVISGLA